MAFDLRVTRNLVTRLGSRARCWVALFKGKEINTIEINFIDTVFLDVTFNLATEEYFPFRNTPLYIKALSNHPPAIIKQLPKMINKRILYLFYNMNSSTKSVYEQHKRIADILHQYLLIIAILKIVQEMETGRIWFNPPYSQNGKKSFFIKFVKFITIVTKHFPRAANIIRYST